jgi:mannose-6-phosphate isomerase-like protein (cupin superfamily)
MFTWLKNLFKKKEAVTWGGRRVLWETPFVRVSHVWVEPNHSTEEFTKQDFALKNWLFLRGNGEYVAGVMRKKLLPGTHPVFTNGTKHAIHAGSERVEVLEIQSGTPVLDEPLQLPAKTGE